MCILHSHCLQLLISLLGFLFDICVPPLSCYSSQEPRGLSVFCKSGLFRGSTNRMLTQSGVLILFCWEGNSTTCTNVLVMLSCISKSWLNLAASYWEWQRQTHLEFQWCCCETAFQQWLLSAFFICFVFFFSIGIIIITTINVGKPTHFLFSEMVYISQLKCKTINQPEGGMKNISLYLTAGKV